MTPSLKHAQNRLSEFYPGYFAMVMATGIVSIAAHLLHFRVLADILFGLNAVLYLCLWVLYGLRALLHFGEVRQDFCSYSRGPAFLTIVAGTCVLGSQCVILFQMNRLGFALWGIGILSWLLLIYGYLFLAIGQKEKPDLGQGINGTWLIMVVATQSLSVLGSLLNQSFPAYRAEIFFLALTLFLLGCLLYLILITLFFHRFLFIPVTPEKLNPPYWISMGAVAITTLAGSRLILHAPELKFLQDLLPFLKGFTLLFWTAGTWLIPLIIILGIWRHYYHRFPLRYDPQYWSMVFPLGMYSVATYTLIRADHFDFLGFLPPLFFGIALVAWLANFVGMLWQIPGIFAESQ